MATALMGAGVLVFAGSVLVSAGILMEGVTHRYGEGNIAPPESPAESRQRLVVLAWLLGAAATGWTLARLGDCWRQPEGQRRRLRPMRLVAELCWFLGGVGICIGILVAWGHRLAAYEVNEDYSRVGIGAALAGPVLLLLGCVLYRCWGRDVDSI
jgi:hypothetical protein